jgi:hypothetical protein
MKNIPKILKIMKNLKDGLGHKKYKKIFETSENVYVFLKFKIRSRKMNIIKKLDHYIIF